MQYYPKRDNVPHCPASHRRLPLAIHPETLAGVPRRDIVKMMGMESFDRYTDFYKCCFIDHDEAKYGSDHNFLLDFTFRLFTLQEKDAVATVRCDDSSKALSLAFSSRIL